jgi:hypothetical protein
VVAWRSPTTAARAEVGAKAGERIPRTMADGGWVGNQCNGQELGNYWGVTHSFCFDGLQDGEGTFII